MRRKILIISPELYPQIKVGGLGKMVAGVSKGLRDLGIEVKVASPKKEIYGPLWQGKTEVNYCNLGRKSAGLCRTENWRPDWLWVHDWGGIWTAESFLKKNSKKPKVLWTIHSPLAEDFGYGYDQDEGPIDWGETFFDFAGLVKKGIELSDRVTTVSSGFAQKISRHQLFEKAETIVGISNGIDSDEWNPKNDNLIGFQLEDSLLEFKKKNRQILQGRFGLPVTEVPIFSFVSRLVPQKGIGLLLKVLPKFIGKNDVQFILVGKGEKKLVQKISQLGKKFPRKVSLKLESDFELPHQIFAGADFLVLPSVTEPFGIVVAEARKYGVIPIVHLVDGLKDQVKDGKNGLGFDHYQVWELEEKLYQALACWQSEWQIKRLGDWIGIESWLRVCRRWLKLFYE